MFVLQKKNEQRITAMHLTQNRTDFFSPKEFQKGGLTLKMIQSFNFLHVDPICWLIKMHYFFRPCNLTVEIAERFHKELNAVRFWRCVAILSAFIYCGFCTMLFYRCTSMFLPQAKISRSVNFF